MTTLIQDVIDYPTKFPGLFPPHIQINIQYFKTYPSKERYVPPTLRL